MYCKTTSQVAREGDVSVMTVNRYAHEGALDFLKLASGAFLFKEDAPERVRQIRAERSRSKAA